MKILNKKKLLRKGFGGQFEGHSFLNGKECLVRQCVHVAVWKELLIACSIGDGAWTVLLCTRQRCLGEKKQKMVQVRLF